VILRGVNLNPGAEPEDMVSLRVWLGPGLIVTLTLRPVRAVADARERVAAGRVARHVADLFLGLVESLTECLKDTVRTSETALEDLLCDPPDWLDDRRRLWLREPANATERTVEALSATREQIGAVQDQLTLSVAERSRRHHQLLAVVATIFLPLNMFAALLGANVGGVPLTNSPSGFWIFLAGTGLALGAALAVAFLSGWLR
jgi:zinc transporter